MTGYVRLGPIAPLWRYTMTQGADISENLRLTSNIVGGGGGVMLESCIVEAWGTSTAIYVVGSRNEVTQPEF